MGGGPAMSLRPQSEEPDALEGSQIASAERETAHASSSLTVYLCTVEGHQEGEHDRRGRRHFESLHARFQLAINVLPVTSPSQAVYKS